MNIKTLNIYNLFTLFTMTVLNITIQCKYCKYAKKVFNYYCINTLSNKNAKIIFTMYNSFKLLIFNKLSLLELQDLQYLHLFRYTQAQLRK